MLESVLSTVWEKKGWISAAFELKSFFLYKILWSIFLVFIRINSFYCSSFSSPLLLFFRILFFFLCFFLIVFLFVLFPYCFSFFVTSFPFPQILIALADAFSMTPYETHSTFSANQQEYQLKLSSRYRSNTTQLSNMAVASARTLGERIISFYFYHFLWYILYPLALLFLTFLALAVNKNVIIESFLCNFFLCN